MPTPLASFLSNPLVLDATSDAVALHEGKVAAMPLGKVLPDSVRQWLARVRLLEGVPFAHLVSDSELLPPESIRFFYLDREWTDALVQGVLSVGTVSSLDREHMQALHAVIRAEVDAEERQVRLVGADLTAPPGAAAAGTISGFLLRSRVVSGWPALHVRGYSAWTGPDDGNEATNESHRLRLLRLERLAPAVLFCLFDGIPDIVHVEEPRQGIQFGVDLTVDRNGDATGATIPLRDVLTAKRLDQLEPPPPGPTTATVPFRKGAPGVIDFVPLMGRIELGSTNVFGETQGSADLAMEMLQFPFRQVFGDQPTAATVGGRGLEDADVFHPTIKMQVVRTWKEGAHV